jgi:myosin heavy subunit
MRGLQPSMFDDVWDKMANAFTSFRFTSGMDVWVADDRECWVRGVIVESRGDTLKVRNNSNKSEKVITVGPNIERELLPANLPQNTNISDIIKTEYLHEASLLETLRVRHANATSSSSSGTTCEEIYTYAGPVLLSCNPYKRLDIYGPDIMHRYSAALEQVSRMPSPLYLSTSMHSHHALRSVHYGSSPCGHVIRASRRRNCASAASCVQHRTRRFFQCHPVRQQAPNCGLHCARLRASLTLFRNDRSSAIVITGESGAGKTEAMKLMLRHLTVVAPNIDGSSSGSGAIERRLLDSSPITEAFGNAKTVRNDNSSRFGKFMELALDKKGCISGGNLRNYMLEKSRISAITAEERSYHIFYMVCEGCTAKERAVLSIPDPEATGKPAALAFNLLKHGRLNVPDKDDVKDMDELRQAVSTCGFSDEIWRQMLSVVAAVLHLSNITFSEGPNDTAVMDQEVGGIVARLLSVECDTLTYCLTHKVITPQGVQQPGGRKRSITVKNLNAQQAGVAAASLSQALYSSMFNFIIHQINSAVIPPSGSFRSIGLLDIFGFEIFAVNKFEQLCINYTNEKLQNLFNHHMFELELQEYATEDVDIAQISFHDNNTTVALFEMKKTGIFDMLDDEMVVPKATDLTYLERLTREMAGKHDSFDRGKSVHDGFVVKHYAHNVKYNVEGFIQKNSDLLTEDITGCLSASSSPFVVELLSFGEEKSEGATERAAVNLQDLGVGMAKAKRKTVGSAFKQQLVSLCERISTMSTFYVRTFKTNANKSSGEFDGPLMLMQLKCSGVMEVMKIRIAGFPTRIKFAEFVRRFWPLHPEARSMQPADACLALLKASKLPAETFAFGKTKVFLKDRPFSQLIIIVKEVLEAQARELQRFVHRLMCQMRLSAVALRALARRALIQKHKAFIAIAAASKRLKSRNRWVAKVTFDGEVAAKNAAERAARKQARDAAQTARVEACEDRETKDRLRQERLRSMVRFFALTTCPIPRMACVMQQFRLFSIDARHIAALQQRANRTSGCGTPSTMP